MSIYCIANKHRNRLCLQNKVDPRNGMEYVNKNEITIIRCVNLFVATFRRTISFQNKNN